VSARPAATALLALALVPPIAGASGDSTPAAATHPVVLELFTSQGCSSCPAADELLSRLHRGGAPAVIPLAFHVDSWNHEGWTDPFSSAEWTRRHAFYARKLGAKGAYTPQVVVDGSTELLGSDARALAAAIEKAAERPAAAVSLELAPVPGADSVRIEVSGRLPEELRGGKVELLVALVETGLETPVKRGENGGRTLKNDHVVRRLEKLGRIDVGEGGAFREAVEISLPARWARPNLSAVAFVQESGSLAIRGAAARPLPPA
jgi:hypothetical protein